MAHQQAFSDVSDERLMALIQDGNHDAFAQLVLRHTKMFFAAAYRVYPSAEECEDIVQDAFLKLWKNPHVWDETRGVKFTTWFYRVVSNQAVDALRKKKNTQSGDSLEWITDDAESQQGKMEQSEEQKILEEAIFSLPERQKTALNLCFYEGMSNKEAAEFMGVGLKALESLLMRAKAGLRDELLRRKLLTRDDKGVAYG